MRPSYLPRLLLATFFVGLLGTSSELFLLEHYEDVKQLIPFGVSLMGLATGGWFALRPGAESMRAFRGVLLVFVVTGVVGVLLHYRGNVEFEVERDSTLRGLALFWESLRGATPALAPGTMIFLAMIGYAATLARDTPLASPRT